MLTVFWTLSLRRPQNRLSFFPERLNQIAPSDWSAVRMLRKVHFEAGGLQYNGSATSGLTSNAFSAEEVPLNCREVTFLQ